MLLSLTCNPAIDRTMLVPGFRTAEVTRLGYIHDAAGGKGLNVTRAAQSLGEPVRALGLLGGVAGQRVAALAAAEGLNARWVWLAAGETRTCQIVLDVDAPDTLIFNENGPEVSAADWQALVAAVHEEAVGADALAVSGSLPPGVATEWFVQLLGDVVSRGTPVWLDTSVAPLKAALDLPLDLIKVNSHELGAVLDRELHSIAETVAAAEAVRQRGPKAVIVTLGKAGAVAVGAAGAWHARTPPVRAISPTGSGDAVLAGVAVTLLRGGTLAEALAFGTACGAANTLTVGGCLLPLDELRVLHDHTEVQQLHLDDEAATLTRDTAVGE